MKLTPKHIRSLIQEELSHLLSINEDEDYEKRVAQMRALKAAKRAKKKGVPLDAAVPTSKSVTIQNALYPIAAPEAAADALLTSLELRAARAAMGGGSQKTDNINYEEVLAFHKSTQEKADISINVELTTVVPSLAHACAGDSASGVILYFDVSGLVPGHDLGNFIGFKTNKDINQYLKLIKDAARSTKENAIIGQVKCYYPIVYVDTSQSGEPDYRTYKEGTVTIGVGPVYNQFAKKSEPAVIIIFGTLKEHDHQGVGGPYFFHPDEALLMAREYERLAAPYMKRNKGLVYHKPSALIVTDRLAQDCGELRLKQRQQSLSNNNSIATVAGLKK